MSSSNMFSILGDIEDEDDDEQMQNVQPPPANAQNLDLRRIRIEGIKNMNEDAIHKFEDTYIGDGKKAVYEFLDNNTVIFVYETEEDATAAIYAFTGLNDKDWNLGYFQRGHVAHEIPDFPQDNLELKYPKQSERKWQKWVGKTWRGQQTDQRLRDISGNIEEPIIKNLFNDRPNRGEKKCEDYRKELEKYQQTLENRLSEAIKNSPATYDEIQNGDRIGIDDKDYTGVPHWATGTYNDEYEDSMMKPGAIFLAATHAEHHKAQKKLTRKEFDECTIVKTHDWSTLIQSKDRPLVCIQVFKSHCVAVPIFTYNGRGLRRNESAKDTDNTWCTHIPIRDIDAWNSNHYTDAVEKYSRFGTTMLFAKKHPKDSTDHSTDRPFYTMHQKALVHFSQLISHRRRTRAIVYAQLTETSLLKLLELVNLVLSPDYKDKTFGEPPGGPYPGVEEYPYDGNDFTSPPPPRRRGIGGASEEQRPFNGRDVQGGGGISNNRSPPDNRIVPRIGPGALGQGRGSYRPPHLRTQPPAPTNPAAPPTTESRTRDQAIQQGDLPDFPSPDPPPNVDGSSDDAPAPAASALGRRPTTSLFAIPQGVVPAAMATSGTGPAFTEAEIQQVVQARNLGRNVPQRGRGGPDRGGVSKSRGRGSGRDSGTG